MLCLCAQYVQFLSFLQRIKRLLDIAQREHPDLRFVLKYVQKTTLEWVVIVMVLAEVEEDGVTDSFAKVLGN